MAQAVKRLFPRPRSPSARDRTASTNDFKAPGRFAGRTAAHRGDHARHRARRTCPSPARRSKTEPSALRALGEHYKVEIIEGIPTTRPIYHQVEFVDVPAARTPSTGHPPSAYGRWPAPTGAVTRATSSQRIYGTRGRARRTRGLASGASRRQERDHRQLGQALDLFSLHPIAPRVAVLPPKAPSSTYLWSSHPQPLRRATARPRSSGPSSTRPSCGRPRATRRLPDDMFR